MAWHVFVMIFIQDIPYRPKGIRPAGKFGNLLITEHLAFRYTGDNSVNFFSKIGHDSILTIFAIGVKKAPATYLQEI